MLTSRAAAPGPAPSTSLRELKDRVARSAKKPAASASSVFAGTSSFSASSRWNNVAALHQTPRTQRRGEEVLASNVRNVVSAHARVVDEMVRQGKWEEAKASLSGLLTDLPEAADTAKFWQALIVAEMARTRHDRDVLLNLFRLAAQQLGGNPTERALLVDAMTPFVSAALADLGLPDTLDEVFVLPTMQRQLPPPPLERKLFEAPVTTMPPHKKLSPRASPMRMTTPPSDRPVGGARRAPPVSVSKLPTPRFDFEDEAPPAAVGAVATATTTAATGTEGSVMEKVARIAATTTTTNNFQTLLGSPALRVPTPARNAFAMAGAERRVLPPPPSGEEEAPAPDTAEPEDGENTCPPVPLLSKSPKLVRKLDSIMKPFEGSTRLNPIILEDDPQPGDGAATHVVFAVSKNRGQKVATPVRRSSRAAAVTGASSAPRDSRGKSTTSNLHAVLEATNYAYKPNPALERLM